MLWDMHLCVFDVRLSFENRVRKISQFFVYFGFSNLLLRQMHIIPLQTGASRISNKRCGNNFVLTKVCKMYTEQSVLNLVIREMLKKILFSYSIIILPFLIVGVFMCIRFCKLVSWFFYIPGVLGTSILAVCAIFIHIYASCPHEQSCKFLKKFHKNIFPFQTRHSYWRLKLRCFRDIRVSAFWWYFSYANLLPMYSNVLSIIINLLLL